MATILDYVRQAHSPLQAGYGSALALLTGTAAGLSGPSGALHPSGAWSLMGRALEGLRLHARKSSPCVAVRWWKREKVRPARSQHPKFGVFARAGRVFSRKSRRRGGVGRIFSRQPVLCPGLVVDAAYFGLAAMGVLHYMTPFCGVSPACRTPVSCNSPDWWHEAYISAAEPSLGWRHSPRLVAMTPRLEAVWCPNRRPPQ